ncbi:MAG TPA: PQQ-binding-like beta-propeller repeat protein, partial [Polyangiaceae bacterium]|nr:PQQ-binding-like beta-propeller repeat protein [Polyangiaceae bacterium]
MSAIHVIVRPRPEQAPEPALAPLYGLFDVIVDGVNLTARIGDGQALSLLAELGQAVAELAAGRRDRATVQLYADDEAWELGLETDADAALITVFRTGPNPEVAVYERRLTFSALREALLGALRELPARELPRGVATALQTARRALESMPDILRRPALERAPVSIGPRSAKGFAFSARLPLRHARPASSARSNEPHVERADLHALLARGEFSVTARGRTTSLPNCHVFLVAERLLQLAGEVFEAWQIGRPLFKRVQVSGGRVSVRRALRDGPLALGISTPELAARGESVTFPEIDPPLFVEAVVRFARAVADAFQRQDAAQQRNLRALALVQAAGALHERLNEASTDDTLTNREPESYRSFGVPARRHEGRGPWEHGGKMRFLARWVAAVPGLDLRSTFLCGDRLIVGSARETTCLDRKSGSVVWRIPNARGASVVTPAGLARFHADGTLILYDLETGISRFKTILTARTGGGASGAVVHTPGLPKLLVVAEGERSITAIDLISGDVRWRHTARRPANFKVRRAGKLLLISGGDCALMALDVASGEAVWRVRDRLPFSGDISVEHDAAFALCTGPVGPSRLHSLDPWSGELRWTMEIEERPTLGQTPLVTSRVVVVPIRDRRGVGALGFDRETGASLWQQAPGLASPTTAWLAVDDAVFANSASGSLLCLDSTSGGVRYSHVFARHV